MPLTQQYTAVPGDVITAARWNNEFGNIYDNLESVPVYGVKNIKDDYGAIGDGVSDDTQPFRDAALDGGLVFIPAGTYIVDYVVLTLSIEWLGEGALTIIKKKANSVSTTYSDSVSYLFDITNANITVGFDKLVLDGNYQQQVTTRGGATPINTQTGVQVYNASATVTAVGGAIKTLQANASASTDRLILRITDCVVQHCVSLGVYFAGTINIYSFAELHVTGCVFKDFAGSVTNYHDGVSLYQGILNPASGYSFSANGVQGHGIFAVDAARVLITNSVFLDTRNPFAAPLTTGYDANVYNLPMCAVMIETLDGSSQDDPLEWSNFTFTGNYVQGCGRAEFIGNGLGVVDFYSRAAVSTITGNSFWNNYSSCIRGKSGMKGLAITGNTIENNPPWTNYNSFGINLHELTDPGQRGDVAISGNTIRGMSQGIIVTGSATPPEDSDAGVADDNDDMQDSTAVGATTNAAGYAIGSSSVTLASAGTGTLVVGDLVTFAGDTNQYTITAGDTDVSNGGTLSFRPALLVTIPASATAITVVTFLKAVNNIVIADNVIHNIAGPEMQAGVLRTAYANFGSGIYCDTVSGLVVSNNIIDRTVAASGSTGSEHGIRIRSCIKALVIAGNVIHRSAADGINVLSHIGPTTVNANQVNKCVGTGISLANNGDNTVTSNVVNNTKTGGIVFATSGTLSAVVTGNSVTNVLGESGSTIAGLDSGSGATALTALICTGNHINTVINSGAGVAYGIRSAFNAAFSDLLTGLISGNTIDTVEESGIFLQDYSGIVSDNIFKAVNLAGNTAHGCILINGVSNIGNTSIKGNVCDSTSLMFPTSGGGLWSTVAAHAIAAGVVTVLLNTGTVLIDTEAAAATDNLDTILGLQDGSITTFRAVSSARDIVFVDGTGNMKLAGNFTANNVEDSITLRMSESTLYELCRSDNGA
jgi:hypothetical protein